MKAFLRLVHDRQSDGGLSRARAHYEPVQESLIQRDSKTLIVCTTDSLDEVGFLNLFSSIRASQLLDFRTSPRFDFGSLNRRRVFAYFEGMGIQYWDFGGRLLADAAVQSAIEISVRDAAMRNQTEDRNSKIGAIVLVDAEPDYREFGLVLANTFRSATGADWDVILQGPEEASEQERCLIFISHATPEDNDFVLWIQAQLTRNGYSVWTDVTHLAGGDVFWDTIEETIRQKAAKVIVVNSRSATVKPGVQDEISLAISIERAQRLSNFIIPIRLDDLPFSEFRANIARKNTIDFRNSWSQGLTQLLDTLKRDRVPRPHGGSAGQLAAWWEMKKPQRAKLSEKPELLISNEFEIKELPKLLFTHRGQPIDQSGHAIDSSKIAELPLIPYSEEWLSFFSIPELQELGVRGLTQCKAAATADVVAGNVSYVSQLQPAARARLVARILNRHWEHFLIARGLIKVPAARGAPTLYVPKGLVEKNQVELFDADGTKRKRLLVGHSVKRKVNWHLGFIARFAVGDVPTLRLRMRVLFSDDVSLQLVPPERMKDLRKRFCKNWWNDRWRTLQIGLTTWLANQGNFITVYAGPSGALIVSARSRTFEVPFGIDESAPAESDLLNDEMELEIDDGDNDFFEDGGFYEEADDELRLV